MIPVINKDNFDSTSWSLYRKKSLTKAMRMEGPFIVQTREGELTCSNGWLAVDAHGWPYPIAADEFEKIYEVNKP